MGSREVVHLKKKSTDILSFMLLIKSVKYLLYKVFFQQS